MVFKEFGKDIINLSKNYKTLNVVTSEQVNSLGLLTNNLNSLKDIGNLTTDSMNGLYKSVQSFGNDNLTYYFQSVAEGAENARVNIVDAYAAILDGNTHGLKNVQSIMNTFNNSFDGSVEKQKEFTQAVGQSNKGLANYLNSIEAGGTATLKGYAGQLVKTTAQTVGLQIATTALNAAISLGLTALITGVIALFDHFIVTLEESRKALSDLKDEYSDIKSNLESVNDELKTTIDRMNELEKKDTLTFTEKEEYDNLKKTNNELERKIALLELEQKHKNKEINQAFVSTMQKDVDKVGEYSKLDGTPTTEKEYIDWQLELRQKHYQSLIKAEQDYNNTKSNVEKKILENDIEYYQGLIDNIDDYLFSKNQLWTADSENIEYISNPSTDDEKAVNEWLDFINDFQDKMAIAMGDTNAKTKAFNRLMDNWQFDGLVQSLQDLGEQGQVTAEMLDDPKYDAFIQKLVLLGIIDSADNLDLIALAFNNLDTSADNASDTTDTTTNSIYNLVGASEDLKESLDNAFGNQSIIQSAFDKIQEGSSLSADEVRKLIELCPQLATEFVKTADGYTIGADKLINANDEIVQSTKQSLQERADYLKQFINTDYDTSGISSSYEAKQYNEWQQSVQSAKTELEGLELILSMFGIILEDTGDKLDELQKAYDELAKSASSYVGNQKSITSALEEQEKYGQLSANTIQELTEAGYAQALVVDSETGAVTLNKQAYEQLNKEKKQAIILEGEQQKLELATKLQEEKKAIEELGKEYANANEERKKAILLEMEEHGASYNDIQARITSINKFLASLDAPTFGDSSKPDSVLKFETELAKRQHEIATGKRKENADYYDWLLSAAHKAYDGLADYEDELWKYEEQVYEWRKDHEQDLFDKKIENYKKLSDNALDKYIDGNGNELTVNASFDYARSQINSAIAETQNRINELSLKIGFEDEIDELTSDLEDLYDTLDDINKKEIESQKEYINELKDNYSDSMDEIIDKQKELADTIDKAYENQIDAIDKQIDAIEKKNEAEKRQNDILEARKKLEEAKREDAKNAYVSFNGTGFTIHQTTEAQDEAQADLDEAKQDEQIAKLEEQKEILETQRDNSKDYYDKVVEDLESQKEAREKQYDILVGIYEQLGGEKKQTSLNESLVNKLTKNGDINKAVQGLTPAELQQAITSGILTTDSDGNYAIDYSILGKNEDAVNKNTAELEKLNSQLSGETNTDTSTVDMTKPHLDSEGYLVGTNGKRVLHDGKGIKATTKAEWEKKKTPYAGFETMTDLFTAIKSGSFNLPNSWSYANQTMNSNIMNSIGKDIKQVPEYVNNVTNSNAPNINFTVNVEGSADQKTVRAMEEKITAKLVEYTDAVTNTFKKKYSSI